MKLTKRRTIYLALILLFVAIILRFLFFSFSLNSLRITIEEEIEWATGLDAIIKGDIEGRLLPSFSISARQVQVKDKSYLNIYAQKLDLELPVWSLFKPGFLIRGIIVNDPVVIWTEGYDNTNQTLSIVDEETPAEFIDTTNWQVDLVDIKILNGEFYYYDKNNQDTIHCLGVNLTSDSIILRGDADTLKFSDVLAMGKLSVDDARINSLLLYSIYLNVDISEGIMDISHSSVSGQGRNRHGNFNLDLSTDIPSYHIQQDINGFRIEEYLTRLDADSLMFGAMDFSLDVRFAGKSSPDLWMSSKGNMELKGNDMTLYGTNLDKVAKQFKRSQKFNLIDVSALFIAGPIGIAATKGSDYATLLIANKGDSTIVHEFISRWSLDSGELKAEDVAFSTDENRIALRGGINLWHETFNDIEFALVNEAGCAVFSQKISGRFSDPDISNLKVVGTVLGPIKNIFKRKKCSNPFYTGSVKPYQTNL